MRFNALGRVAVAGVSIVVVVFMVAGVPNAVFDEAQVFL